MFSESSTQNLSLLVTKLHPSAPIVLGLPWLRTTHPTIDWETLSLTFSSGTASLLPRITVAMACTTTSLHSVFDTIPELHTASMDPPPSVLGLKNLSPPSDYVPDTVGENLLKTVADASFPNITPTQDISSPINILSTSESTSTCTESSPKTHCKPVFLD
jgi:hypothetical protein